MRPEPTAWPAIDRLLECLPADVPTGVFERKRLEHVLTVARVPQEDEAFARWIEEDRERLARWVTAVVGMAPAHRDRVEHAVAAWWEDECARRRRDAGKGEGIDARGEARGGGAEVGPAKVEVPTRWWSSRRAWGMGLLVVGIVGVGVWAARVELDEDARDRDAAANGLDDTVEQEASDRGEASTGSDAEASTGGAKDDGAPDDVSPVQPEPGVPVPEVVLDLSDLSVRVPVATLTVVPGEPVVPWWPMGIATLALVCLVVLWRVKAPLGEPGPPIDLPRPLGPPRSTSVGRVPPRGRPLRRVLLDRAGCSALVSGNAREPDGRLTDRIDVQRSIDETIAMQIPTLCFVRGSEHRGVWIWRDTNMHEHSELASRLQTELESTLREAGLPVRVATFQGVPTLLRAGRERLHPTALLGVGGSPRVVVLTDGDRLRRRLRSADTRTSTEGVLRLLRRWDGLALVDFGGPRSALAVLAREFHVPRITPEHAATHLAGQARREGPMVGGTRGLSSWEVACAMAPRVVLEDDAQRLRLALQLDASAFDIGGLRACASGSGRAQLWWSVEDRAEVFARYERGHGYLAAWPGGGAALLREALGFWRGIYDEAIAVRAREGADSDTVAYLEIERAVLQLWERSEGVEATRSLYERWQTEALRETVAELVSHYADAAGPKERVRLPWSYAALLGSEDERERDAAWMLAEMGLVRKVAEVRALVPLRRGGRRALAIGVLLGVTVTAGWLVVEEAERTQVEAAMVGRAPEGATVGCEVRSVGGGQAVRCEMEARHLVEGRVLETDVFGEGQGAQRVELSWEMKAQACEGELESGARYVICDRKGKLRRQVNGQEEWSRAVVVTAGGRALAQDLLDSGSIDLAVMADAGALGTDEVARVLGGAGERLVVVGEDVGAGGSGGPVWALRMRGGGTPSLAFVRSTPVGKLLGDRQTFEVIEMRLPVCPEGTRYIEGGSFGGQRVESFCLDTTEVTVVAYEACVQRGTCTADTGTYCNTGKAERSDHPINCVDWEQAKAFCAASNRRLPTEQEWEWAARGRDRGWTYPWGNEPEPSCERVVMDESASGDDKRWGCDTGATWPVGSKPKGDSRDGLKDMAGNVWEWTSSVQGEMRIVRGGSWGRGSSGGFRASDRFYHPADRLLFVGFRCATESAGSP